MMKNKYADYIRAKLDKREILEQLAEEASELSKAALKVIRARGMSKNATPVNPIQAENDLIEEAADVMGVLALLIPDERYDNFVSYWKIERWAERLGYKE